MSDGTYTTNELERTRHHSVEVGTQDITLNRAEVMAGAQAGVGAGLAMGIMAVIVSLAYGFGPWTPFNDVAAVIVRPLPGAEQSFNLLSVVVGLIIHFSSSIILGMFFAAVYAGGFKLTFDFGMPFLVGIVFGLCTWLLARYIFLPLVAPDVYGAPAFLTAHAVFGATLGILYPYMPARR